MMQYPRRSRFVELTRDSTSGCRRGAGITRRHTFYIAAALLSLHVALLSWSATRHPPVGDEPAHLVAGLSHWKLGNFDVFRENPPLVHMVVAAPVLICGLQTYPHSRSYFNSVVGGPLNGPRHLLFSNTDSGQDLCYLRDWQSRHRDVERIRLAYYGGFDPGLIGIRYAIPPLASAETDQIQLSPGWYAISVKFLQGAPRMLPSQNGFVPSQLDELSYFRELQPTERCGYSLWLFHVTEPVTLVRRGRRFEKAAPMSSPMTSSATGSP